MRVRYMGGMSFIPFVNPPPKGKKGAPAPEQFVPTKEQLDEMDSSKQSLQGCAQIFRTCLSGFLHAASNSHPLRIHI